SEADTVASAAGPPRHAPSDADATATSAVIRHVSSAPAIPELPTTMAVAKPADVRDTPSPLARASETSSFTARTAMRNATARKISGGAYQTTPTASAISTAPLSTRVIASAIPSISARRATCDVRRVTALSLCAERHPRRLDAAVPPLALLVGDD